MSGAYVRLRRSERQRRAARGRAAGLQGWGWAGTTAKRGWRGAGVCRRAGVAKKWECRKTCNDVKHARHDTCFFTSSSGAQGGGVRGGRDRGEAGKEHTTVRRELGGAGVQAAARPQQVRAPPRWPCPEEGSTHARPAAGPRRAAAGAMHSRVAKRRSCGDVRRVISYTVAPVPGRNLPACGGSAQPRAMHGAGGAAVSQPRGHAAASEARRERAARHEEARPARVPAVRVHGVVRGPAPVRGGAAGVGQSAAGARRMALQEPRLAVLSSRGAAANPAAPRRRAQFGAGASAPCVGGGAGAGHLELPKFQWLVALRRGQGVKLRGRAGGGVRGGSVAG